MVELGCDNIPKDLKESEHSCFYDCVKTGVPSQIVKEAQLCVAVIIPVGNNKIIGITIGNLVC